MRLSVLAGAATACVAVLCMWLACVAQAAGPVLTVDPADTPLRISGVLDEQTNSFGGNLRLTVTGGDAEQVHFLASDLRDATQPEIVIDRSSVTVPADTSLSAGQPSDVKVTVADVERAGDYAGTLRLLLPGQALTQALTIPLELHVSVAPDVAPVLAERTFQVARCEWFDCFLAALLLNGSATRNVWHVQLDNRSSQPVTVSHALAVMQGERIPDAVTPSQVAVHAPEVLPANSVSTVPVTITRNSLLPDQYKGDLRFTVAGLEDPVTISATLAVRNGPWWALFAVLVGILVGRMARDMETPVARKQVKLLPESYDLAAQIDRITDEPARRVLERDLHVARAKIDSTADTEEVASKSLAELEAKVDFLTDLQGIEGQLQTLPDGVQEKVRPLVQKSRSFLLDGEVKKAEEARAEITDVIHGAQTDTMMSTSGDIQHALASVAAYLARPAGPSPVGAEQALQEAGQRQASRWRRFLAGLSGLQFVTAETRFWYFRPVLSVVLLVVLVLLGLQTLYVNTGAAFGVGGLYDYLALFLWGITADVAQRTLLNLPAAGG